MTTTVSIDGQALAYSVRAADGTYVFQVAGGEYQFRQWTWGEKNRVVDAATMRDVETGRLRVDIARFNELMLSASLVPSPSAEVLRELNPVLGDTLLAIAYWVNEVAVEDKKVLTQALRERLGHPHLTLFRLCQEFGWTPAQVRDQTAADIETFVLILDELERQSALVAADEDATTILIAAD